VSPAAGGHCGHAVGVTIAVQGFEFGNSGPCFGQLRANNTADLTIR